MCIRDSSSDHHADDCRNHDANDANDTSSDNGEYDDGTRRRSAIRASGSGCNSTHASHASGDAGHGTRDAASRPGH